MSPGGKTILNRCFELGKDNFQKKMNFGYTGIGKSEFQNREPMEEMMSVKMVVGR